MSNWIAITESLVQTRAAGPELDALKTSALPEGKTGEEILSEVIAQVVDKVRGYCTTAVRKGFLKSMGEAGTVPSRLLGVTLNTIRYELITRIPGLGKRFLDEARMKAADKDDRQLKDVATGEFSIEDPEAEETSVSTPSPSISGRQPQYRRDDQDGV